MEGYLYKWRVSYQLEGNADGDWDTYLVEGDEPPTKETWEEVMAAELCGFKVEEVSEEDLEAQRKQMAELRAQEDALFYSPPPPEDREEEEFYPEEEEFREPPASYYAEQNLAYAQADLDKCKAFMEKFLREAKEPNDESNDEFLSRLLEAMEAVHREVSPGDYYDGDE